MIVFMKVLMALIMMLVTCLNAQERDGDEIDFEPIQHGTFVIRTTIANIYIDPVGDKKIFENFPDPDIILITDIHGDHLDTSVVDFLATKKTTVIGPKAVIDRLKHGVILNNGESKIYNGVNVEAIPMYNLTEERLRFHEKGRGNGYVITVNKKRIYISGDTEDITEMRALKNIDFAFICMNLPYTMDIDQAASAVLEMKPEVVFPYHYRGTDGFSDIEKFKQLVEKNKTVKVRLLNWYP